MTPSMFHALWTALLLATFIGIVVWAYSDKRRERFDAAARLPLDEEEMDSHLPPLSARGRGQGERGLRATSRTRGEK